MSARYLPAIAAAVSVLAVGAPADAHEITAESGNAAKPAFDIVRTSVALDGNHVVSAPR